LDRLSVRRQGRELITQLASQWHLTVNSGGRDLRVRPYRNHAGPRAGDTEVASAQERSRVRSHARRRDRSEPKTLNATPSPIQRTKRRVRPRFQRGADGQTPCCPGIGC